MADAKDFLFEIGTEEMPSAPLNNAVKQLGTMIAKGLDEAGLAHGEVRVISSPRRLAALVADVATATDEVHEVKRGPAANIAFDADGNATKAAQGFARKCGVAAEDLVRREDTDGREYVFAEKNIPSAPATPILTALCEKTIAGLQWPNYRSQRWGHEHASFVRPVRWICCLLGEDVVPVSFADVTSGNTTRGHRVLGPGDHVVASPAVYEQVLEDAGVLSAERRREAILAGIAEVEAARPGCHVDTPKKVFEEVINLCEWPTVLVGTFDEEFLKVPHEIICESMLTNQRYFPIYDGEGKLTREFVVSNAVVEFTSQQGVMGGYYATAMGENDEVAHAIRDHYRPRFAGDELPEGTAGCIVACADKLDTIAGIFAIGEPPTGSSDPYALRRAAIGIINILRDRLPIDPTSLIDFALELYSEQGIEFDAAKVAQQVRDFFHGRLVSMARDEKIPADTVAAVSAVHIIAPSVFFARCAALDEARKNDAETFDNLATAYARAAHISKPELGAEYDRGLMGEVELALADASEAAQTAVDAALAAEDYPAAFAALAALRAPIDRFFDEVMVMDKDEQLRDNRLKLLNRFEAVFSGIANIGELARKK